MHIEELAIADPQPIVCQQRIVDRKTMRQMIEVTVAAAFNLPVEELAAKTRRTAPVAFARQVCMYCAHVSFGWSLTDAGSVFDRDRTTAAHACRVVEDRRDELTVDALVDSVESALHQWLQAVAACRSANPRRCL